MGKACSDNPSKFWTEGITLKFEDFHVSGDMFQRQRPALEVSKRPAKDDTPPTVELTIDSGEETQAPTAAKAGAVSIPAKSAPAKKETVKKEDAKKTEAPKPAASAEKPKTEAAKTETKKEEPKKEAAKTEPAKEAAKTEPAKAAK